MNPVKSVSRKPHCGGWVVWSGLLLFFSVAVAAHAATGFPVTVTDALERQVTVAQRPERLVSLAPSVTELLFALGLGSQVVGVTQYCDYPPEARTRPSVGGIVNPSLERIVGLQPDLVIGIRGIPLSTFRQLERVQVVSVALDPHDLDQVLATFRLLGRLTGTTDAARAVTRRLRRRLDTVRARLGALRDHERPSVLFVLTYTPRIWTCGRETFVDDVIWRAGGRNLARDRKDFHPISMETLLRRQPDIIVIADGQNRGGHRASVEAFLRLPGAHGLHAVRAGRLVTVPSDPLVRPGPRLVDGVEALARVLHPERFREDDG